MAHFYRCFQGKHGRLHSWDAATGLGLKCVWKCAKETTSCSRILERESRTSDVPRHILVALLPYIASKYPVLPAMELWHHYCMQPVISNILMQGKKGRRTCPKNEKLKLNPSFLNSLQAPLYLIECREPQVSIGSRRLCHFAAQKQSFLSSQHQQYRSSNRNVTFGNASAVLTV